MAGGSKLLMGIGAGAVALAAVPAVIRKLRAKPTDKKGEDPHEFGGTVGAFGTMVNLPVLIFALYYMCNKDFVVPGVNLARLVNMPLPRLGDLISTKAVGVCLAWFGFQVALERVLPGETVTGVDLRTAGGEGKLEYKMNGHAAFWVSTAALGGAALTGAADLGYLYDAYPALAGSSIVLSGALSAYLYWKSFEPGVVLAKGGSSGVAIYDFFMGRELNPRIGNFDLKEFCELRPGLIGWVALNLGMAVKQYHSRGAVSGSMLLVNALQGLYVWDSLYHERAILTTMDITTDGFGYMLAFGDLAWVPFTYGLQARYLVDHDPDLPVWALGMIAAIGAGGYTIFRGSNGQKDTFRTDRSHPSVQHLKTIKVQNQVTGRPSELIASGWWGLARKINYTGDWCMAWSWSLTTGFGSVITYFYPIYFAVLLVHRAARDDHFCREKYGKDWDKYKKAVPYVFFPGLI